MKVSNLYIAQIKQKHGIIDGFIIRDRDLDEMANKIVREIIHAKGIDIGIYTKDF